MKNETTLRKTVFNSAGNVLLQVLAIASAMGVVLYFLINYVVGHKQQVAKTMNLVSVRFAMNSTMDYLIFGVRQKYCFSNDGLLLNSSPLQCNLSHPGSVERLIMSAEQENFILQLIGNNRNVGPVDPNNIRLSNIKSYLSVNAATANHPLFSVLQSLKRVKTESGDEKTVDGIEVELSRDDSVFLPLSGREVFIKLKVSLMAKKGDSKPLYFGATPLTVTSQVIIYPREVGSFALLVPNDLYLDRPWDSTVGDGDVVFHKFTSRSALGWTTGLVFQSPVFVNRNIHLPKDNYPASASLGSISYSPVTFADRVYLGNGRVYSNGNPYMPKTPGGDNDRFWSDIRTFGGFLKGLENDGGADLGLQYFAKIISGPVPNAWLMARCIERSQRLASRNNLYSSRVGVTLKESSGNSFRYRVFLSNQNSFQVQEGSDAVTKVNWGAGQADLTADATNSVLNVKVFLGDRSVAGDLDREGKLVLVPQVGSSSLTETYAAALRNAEAAYAAAQTANTNLQNDLSRLRSELDQAKIELANERAKASPSADLIRQLQSQVDNLQTSVDQITNTGLPAIKQQQSTALASVETARTNKNNYDHALANPPRITVEARPAYNRRNQMVEGKVNLTVSVENVKSLIDQNGNYTNPSVMVKAYDGTYYNAQPISSPANANLQGYLNFSISDDKLSILAPTLLSSTLTVNNNSTLVEDETDYEALDQQCEQARDSQPSQSFGGAGWNVSFAENTRMSWNFAGGIEVGKDPGLDKLELFGLTRSNASFQVRSIVGKCIIDDSSTFITGFFTCDELEILPRTRPLRIIGTFIVGKMKIAPTALKKGITWSSIYHPQATRELQFAGPAGRKVLRSFSGRSCNAIDVDPIWHPIPSVQEVSDRRGCNAIGLRSNADPFQWTSVDPDCGIPKGADASNTTCKRRLIRFFVVEQSRESAL